MSAERPVAPALAFEPLGARIFIRRNEADGMRGRLHLPETAREAPLMGYVVAVGPDVTTLERGDVVVYPRLSGDKLDLVGLEGEHLVMSEDEILGRMR